MLLRKGEETTPFTDCKLGPVSVILTRFTVIRGPFPYIEPDEYQNIIMKRATLLQKNCSYECFTGYKWDNAAFTTAQRQF